MLVLTAHEARNDKVMHRREFKNDPPFRLAKRRWCATHQQKFQRRLDNERTRLSAKSKLENTTCLCNLPERRPLLFAQTCFMLVTAILCKNSGGSFTEGRQTTVSVDHGAPVAAEAQCTPGPGDLLTGIRLKNICGRLEGL